MKKVYINSAIFILGMCLFTLVYLGFAHNTPEQYNDVILYSLAIQHGNKSLEILLYYILSLFGIGFILWQYVFNKTNQQQPKLPVPELILSLVSLSCIGYLSLYGCTSIIFLFIPLYTFLIYLKDKHFLIPGLVCFFSSLYVFYALYRIYSVFANTIILEDFTPAIFTLLISLLVLYNDKLRKNINRILLIHQLFTPFLLLMYLANKYEEKNDIISYFDVPTTVKILIYTLIIIFIVEVVRKIKIFWNTKTNLNNIISIGTCISIPAFNLIDSYGKVPSYFDLHHHFENIIGFYQIVEYGMEPFKNYTPLSGFFSVLQGAFYRIFANNMYEFYNVSESIFFLFAVCLTVLLLWKRIPHIQTFIISVCFYFIRYNRTIFILPILLLLTDPRIIRNKNIWIILWILTTFFQGLYYPIFGVATGLAFLPFGIYQIITYIKSSKIKSDIKTMLFWIEWIGCLTPIVLSKNILIGLFHHLQVVSTNTILANGLTRVGFKTSIRFLPYLNDTNTFKLLLFYLLTFIIPAIFVWVTFLMVLKAFNIKKESVNYKIRNLAGGLILLSLPIFILMIFNSMTIRLEPNYIYARLASILFAIGIMMIVFAHKYIRNSLNKFLVFLVVLSVPVTSGLFGFGDRCGLFADDYRQNVKLLPYSQMNAVYNLTYKAYNNFVTETKKNADISKPYFGSMSYGVYELCHFKGASTIESQEIRSYELTQYTVNNLKKTLPYIFVSNNTARWSYYLYNWILTSGNYVYNTQRKIFEPNNGKYSLEDVRRKNLAFKSVFELSMQQNITNTFGLYYKSINKFFETNNTEFYVITSKDFVHIKFNKPIKGWEADFIYLEFDNMDKNFVYAVDDWYYNHPAIIKDKNIPIKKYFVQKIYNPYTRIHLSWTDHKNKKVKAQIDIGDGHLLIPIGAYSDWLLNEHKDLYIYTSQKLKPTEMPKLNKIEFLQLRKVK